MVHVQFDHVYMEKNVFLPKQICIRHGSFCYAQMHNVTAEFCIVFRVIYLKQIE